MLRTHREALDISHCGPRVEGQADGKAAEDSFCYSLNDLAGEKYATCEKETMTDGADRYN